MNTCAEHELALPACEAASILRDLILRLGRFLAGRAFAKEKRWTVLTLDLFGQSTF